MKNWPCFVAAPVVMFTPAAQATSYLSVEQAQQAIFPGKQLTAIAPKISDTQRRLIARKSGISDPGRDPRIWRVAGGGWFFVDEVLGKHELITYALGIGTDGRVRGVEILEYREAYGYQIRNKEWRGQFVGRTAADPLELDRDVKNISGATLSCRHVTDAIKRLLALHEAVLT